MTENKFLRNLNQPPRSSGPPPASPPAVASMRPPAIPPTSGSTSEYDPIRRLTEELSRHSGAIEGLTALIIDMNKRPQAATQAELRQLLNEARKGITYTIDAPQLADLVLPPLQKGLPSPENIREAANEGAEQISQVSKQAAEQLAQSTHRSVQAMERATRSQANALASRIGFTSWQAALLIGLIPLLSGAGLLYFYQENSQQRQANVRQQEELTAWKSFGLWVSEKYPQVRKAYDRSGP